MCSHSFTYHSVIPPTHCPICGAPLQPQCPYPVPHVPAPHPYPRPWGPWPYYPTWYSSNTS